MAWLEHKRIADGDAAGLEYVAVDAHARVAALGDEPQNLGVARLATRMIGDRDAAFDRRADAQANWAHLQIRALQLPFALRKLGGRSNEKVGTEAFPFDRVTEMRAQLVEPAIDDDRDWSVVKKTLSFTHFNVHTVRAGSGARRVFIGDQMKAIVFFSAIRLADPNVSRSDEKGARAVALKS